MAPRPGPGERGDSSFARYGLLLGPSLALLVWLLPTPAALSPEAHRLAALTTLMATWWMTEALPVAVTALVPLALFPLVGIKAATEVAPSYGHDLIWLFFGGFQLAFAVEASGLHKRVALFLVRVVGTKPERLVLGFMLAAGLLSMWLLNTSTTLMMLPVGMAVAVAIEGEEPGPFGKTLMLGIAYAASVGGMGTFIGTAPNGVFAGVAREQGIEVSFGQWMLFAAPLSVLLIFFIWAVLVWGLGKPKTWTRLGDADVTRGRLAGAGGRWSGAELRVALIFGGAVAAWVGRRFVMDALELPSKSVTDATIAVTAALLLYMTPLPKAERSATRSNLLSWRDSQRTPWHILVLFGGGFALASSFQSTGLSVWVGQQLALAVGGLPQVVVILAVVLMMTFLTEVTSNTATATVLLPVIAGLAAAMDQPPLILMVPATLAASCAFMLPVATPPNAIVYASGRFRLSEMARAGIWLNLGTAVLITIWTLTWGAWTLPT